MRIVNGKNFVGIAPELNTAMLALAKTLEQYKSLEEIKMSIYQVRKAIWAFKGSDYFENEEEQRNFKNGLQSKIKVLLSKIKRVSGLDAASNRCRANFNYGISAPDEKDSEECSAELRARGIF